MVWLLAAVCLALSKKQVRQAACALESFVVEEPEVKRSLIEFLETWDRNNTFHLVVLNGYFATGKTYLATVLSSILAVGGHPVRAFVAHEALGSSNAYHDEVKKLLRADSNLHPTFIFDDLPCWKDTKRVISTLEKCMQFPDSCRGALFIITSNDGWCDHDYCNFNVELDRLLGQLLEREREQASAAESDADTVGACVLEGVGISREECEYRGCVCTGKEEACERCMLKKAEASLFDQLRKASSLRSSEYIATRLGDYPHFPVLGHNAYWSTRRSHAHFVKLIDRMLAHSVSQDLQDYKVHLVYPASFSTQLATLGEVGIEGEMARRLRQMAHKLVRGPTRGGCGGACAKMKEWRVKFRIPGDATWSLYMWCDGNSGASCKVKKAVVPWVNPSGDNYLHLTFESELSETIRHHITGISGVFSQLDDLVGLHLRKRRSKKTMQGLAAQASEAAKMIQRDAKELSDTIDAIVAEWKADCPHFRIHAITVVPALTLPAECNDKAYRKQHDILVVPRECTFSATRKLGALCKPRPVIPNPFSGSIILQLGSYSMLNPRYWIRNSAEKACDGMASMHILVASIPVVASWTNPLNIQPPEIPTSQKQGCRYEEENEMNYSGRRTAMNEKNEDGETAKRDEL